MNEITRPSMEWVEEHLIEVVERCMEKKPVLGPDGKPTGEYTMFNPTGALRALELAAKILGMFEKTETNQPVVFTIGLPEKNAS